MNEQKQSKRWIGYLLLAVMAAAFLYRGVYQVATGKAQWDVQTAFLTMLILVIIGEVISTATKAFVPSMFITAVLFVLGFWTYLPADILQQAGIASNLPTFLVMMMVVHLGTMLDIQELIDQWKTVVVTLAGMLGILVVILTVGTVILGKETAAVAAPPLTGGFVAAMMMQSVAPTEHLANPGHGRIRTAGLCWISAHQHLLKEGRLFRIKAIPSGNLESCSCKSKSRYRFRKELSVPTDPGQVQE